MVSKKILAALACAAVLPAVAQFDYRDRDWRYYDRHGNQYYGPVESYSPYVERRDRRVAPGYRYVEPDPRFRYQGRDGVILCRADRDAPHECLWRDNYERQQRGEYDSGVTPNPLSKDYSPG